MSICEKCTSGLFKSPDMFSDVFKGTLNLRLLSLFFGMMIPPPFGGIITRQLNQEVCCASFASISGNHHPFGPACRTVAAVGRFRVNTAESKDYTRNGAARIRRRGKVAQARWI